jgi:site-specific DNA recombinase
VGGRAFDKNGLFKLLTNIVYLGKVRYREEIHPGEHAAIVDEQIWQRVQGVLQRNRRTGGALVRNKYGALLKGLLRCGACDCSMGHAYTSRGAKRYRYYVCLRAQKRGWHNCPTKSVPAGEMERFVIEQIKAIGKDRSVLTETLRQARGLGKKQLTTLQAEERALGRELAKQNAALLTSSGGADTEGNLRVVQVRVTQLREEIVALSRNIVEEREVEAALSVFDPVWDTLSPREQARMIRLLIERVDYNGQDGTIDVTFRANGIKTLAHELQEVAA